MMKGIIRAIALGAFIQVVIGAGLSVWLFTHNNDMALQYSQMAERNANTYTDEVVRDQYNRLQLEQSRSREDMRLFVDKRVALKLSQAIKELKNEIR